MKEKKKCSRCGDDIIGKSFNISRANPDENCGYAGEFDYCKTCGTLLLMQFAKVEDRFRNDHYPDIVWQVEFK